MFNLKSKLFKSNERSEDPCIVLAAFFQESLKILMLLGIMHFLKFN